MFPEQSGAEASAQAWLWDQACHAGLLTGMGLRHLWPPPTTTTYTHILEVSSTWPHDLTPWVAEVRRQESKRNRKGPGLSVTFCLLAVFILIISLFCSWATLDMKLCHLQTSCILANSFSDFSANVISSSGKILNIKLNVTSEMHEGLMLFKTCGCTRSFAFTNVLSKMCKITLKVWK